jgi:sugar phosphate isomerase/epimerase
VLLQHPDHPARGVRLGYGLNLYPSRDAAGVLAALRAVALPLRARIATDGGPFGVGAWMPAAAAREFLADERRLDELATLCATGGLDPFTFNAFPQGEFHGERVKERVFAPGWDEPARLAFTLDVARLAVRLRARLGRAPGAHLSISTHAGGFGGAHDPELAAARARGFVAAAQALARLEDESGVRIVLALEPEPRSSANDTRELADWLDFVRARGDGAGRAAAERHLGACLDACHAAVEFEAPEDALANATRGTPLGKLQFSSALALRTPGDAESAARLLALDEPVYLHQVTGRHGERRERVTDLDALATLPPDEAARWRACDEWRCHFHVPVDLAELGGPGLATTRAYAEGLLDLVLAAPERWGTHELHVEVETYTWSLFTSAQTGAATLVDGLERELRHVLAHLARAGWTPA